MVLKTVPHYARTSEYPPLVLIIENDSDTRLMLKYLLEMWKYRVIDASEEAEAIQLAIDNRPDLILISSLLPGIEGLTAARRMREVSALERTKIIFISSSSDEQTRAFALAQGALDFLVKPIDFGRLEKSLDRCLKRSPKQSRASSREVLC